jgi:AbrB family looped-hinge helix DNA binding protein
VWYDGLMSYMTPQTPAHYTLHLGHRGRLVLPAEVRHRLDLKDGDRLILTVETDGSLRLQSAREAARHGRGLLRQLLPPLEDRCLSEELIAERRAEAERE